MKGVDPSGLFGGGFPDPNDFSPSQDKYYTSSLTGRGTGIPAANKFFRFASSFIPGVGQLLGFHEAVSGCDVTGEPVSNLDRVLGGLPAAGAAAGVLGGAGKALGKVLSPSSKIAAVGKYDHVATSLAEAENLVREAYPEAEVVPRAYEGVPRAKPVNTEGPWWQIHPSEPIVKTPKGESWPHIKYNDYTRGKRSSGNGSSGHIFFPPED